MTMWAKQILARAIIIIKMTFFIEEITITHRWFLDETCQQSSVKIWKESGESEKKMGGGGEGVGVGVTILFQR